MVTEDTQAFVEHLEVPIDDKRADRHRRRVAEAEVDVFEVMAEMRLLTRVLSDMERADGVATGPADRAASLAGSNEREIENVRVHLNARRDELQRKREHLSRLEVKARELDARRRKARMFRLHSADHYVDYSESRYELLHGSQRARPILVSRSGGRRWWWYLDRFWWDDARLSPAELKATIDELELDRSLQRHLREEARVGAFGLVDTSRTGGPIPEAVLLVVWRRETGRCADCGSVDDLRFERITPVSKGVAVTPEDLELCCRMCSVLREQPGSGARVWDVAEV